MVQLNITENILRTRILRNGVESPFEVFRRKCSVDKQTGGIQEGHKLYLFGIICSFHLQSIKKTFPQSVAALVALQLFIGESKAFGKVSCERLFENPVSPDFLHKLQLDSETGSPFAEVMFGRTDTIIHVLRYLPFTYNTVPALLE